MDLNKKFEIYCFNGQVNRAVIECGHKLNHYTSLNAFLSILANKEIWFGDVSNMNDKSEINFFVNKVFNTKNNNKIKNEVKKRLKQSSAFAFCLSANVKASGIPQHINYNQDKKTGFLLPKTFLPQQKR